jgi:hypothetical protein
MKKTLGLQSKIKTPLGFCDGTHKSCMGSGRRSPEPFNNSYDPHFRDEFHRAAARGDLDLIKRLLKNRRCSLNDRDRKQR